MARQWPTLHVEVDVHVAGLPGAVAHTQLLAHVRLVDVLVQPAEVVAQGADALLADVVHIHVCKDQAAASKVGQQQQWIRHTTGRSLVLVDKH